MFVSLFQHFAHLFLCSFRQFSENQQKKFESSPETFVNMHFNGNGAGKRSKLRNGIENVSVLIFNIIRFIFLLQIMLVA